eukprot:11775-Heterococcus_DN1.PRE.1
MEHCVNTAVNAVVLTRRAMDRLGVLRMHWTYWIVAYNASVINAQVTTTRACNQVRKTIGQFLKLANALANASSFHRIDAAVACSASSAVLAHVTSASNCAIRIYNFQCFLTHCIAVHAEH